MPVRTLAPSDEACIRADNVWKVYDTAASPLDAVAGVSFSVRRGEFVSILGPSGWGKSTLLLMCAGLEPVTRGNITVEGTPMAGPRTSIGMIFQDSVLLSWKTVLQNVMFPTHILHGSVKNLGQFAALVRRQPG